MSLLNWKQLKPHYLQSRMYRSRARFVAAVCGRGSGKTEIARRRIVRALFERVPGNRQPLYLYGLPTFQQAKKVAWQPILDLIPKEVIKRKNESELWVETIFGSRLLVAGLDSPQRYEGVQYCGIVLDESSDYKPGVFNRSLLPAMSTFNAWCWRIGVPKRFGSSAVEYKEFFDIGTTGGHIPGTNDRVESYTWRSDTILSEDQISFARATLDEKDYEEQYGASWETAGGQVFHAFSNDNVKELKYLPELPLYIGSDFNVDPMCWVIGHVFEKKLYIFDELHIRDCNTEKALDELWRRYSEHKAGFHFFGDAAASARKTAASSAAFSDYAWINNDKRFDKYKRKGIHYLSSNPPMIDRFSSTNMAFRSTDGSIRCMIDPKCKYLIKDIRARMYKEGTRLPEDSDPMVGHMTDALGYLIHRLFPVSITVHDNVQSVNFQNFGSAA